MTTKRKRPGTPRKGFVMPMKGKRTMVATVPGPDEFDLDPEMADCLSPFFRLLKGNREQIRMKISMIVLTAHSPGKKRMSGTEAYLSLNPDVKRTSAASTGSRLWREITSEIGPEGMDTIDGVHVRRINRILADASGATFTRQFITRSGRVVTAPPLVDHSLRLRSAELMMKKLGIGKEDDRSQPLVVNVISYLGGDPAKIAPWPGGGRVCADGVLHDVVGPNRYRPALPAPPDLIGGNRGERDD